MNKPGRIRVWPIISRIYCITYFNFRLKYLQANLKHPQCVKVKDQQNSPRFFDFYIIFPCFLFSLSLTTTTSTYKESDKNNSSVTFTTKDTSSSYSSFSPSHSLDFFLFSQPLPLCYLFYCVNLFSWARNNNNNNNNNNIIEED